MKQQAWTHWEDIMHYPEKIPPEFYTQSNVILLARKLLGKVLVTHLGSNYTSGIICETEAYNGIHDQASHAFGGRRTNRTEIMYQEGGVAYVYLCYGIHSLFNVVTGKRDHPYAILIRAIIPCDGISFMKKRRNKPFPSKGFSSGPGSAAQALGIHYMLTGTSLQSDEIWIEDRGIRPATADITVTPRIGVDYAGSDADLPYRFVWEPPLSMNVESFRVK